MRLGREGVWVPDYRAVHRATGLDVFIEVLGFWKKSSLDRLLRLFPRLGPPQNLEARILAAVRSGRPDMVA